ncbi:LytTR family DNA-binding domain-containing protein [Faecalibacterium sp. An122]|uniref:LytR/AlgR family response regulator transcription factor n=1 Tax=Faecalibacterium sp. An122 TaxID=1965551 RepID=UPI0013026354|nr:LytTR family DNA-binding domain-containing protein [Faecalibacterium sp. An122]
MKILVCDDDQKALGRVTALLAEPCRKIQAQLTATEHPEQLKDLSGFDLAFLDIDMKGLNGLTLARRLRAARSDAVIVFVTNFIQYAPEGYEVQAFRYLLKPTLEEKLPACFSLAVEEIKRRRQSIVVRSDGNMVELHLRDVLYFESNQRIVTAFLSSGESEPCRFYASLTELTRQLEDAGFLRIQRSYLVNMAYIQQFQYGSVELQNGVRLPVSAKNYAQHKQQYLLWKGQTTWRFF